MKTIQEKSCACDGGCNMGAPVMVEKDAPSSNTQMTARYILLGVPMLAAWWFIYKSLEPFAGWLARHLCNPCPLTI